MKTDDRRTGMSKLQVFFIALLAVAVVGNVSLLVPAFAGECAADKFCKPKNPEDSESGDSDDSSDDNPGPEDEEGECDDCTGGRLRQARPQREERRREA